ncbi:sulfotransferase [Frigidibacter sp. MR17.14]|uniref:sulfotransferase n=1 Tax=Frigidibacter sp. MR17.14 TaxID=3126509 RepID=UPI003012FB8C
MATLVALGLGLLAFVTSLKLMRAEDVGARLVATARTAGATMAAPDLGDAEKEAAMRAAAGRLFLGFFRIGGIGLAALGLSGLIVWAGAALGLYTMAEALALASDGVFLLASGAIATALWVALPKAGRGRRPEGERAARPDDIPYGRADRALHRLAFAGPGLQKALAQVETDRYADRIDLATARRPVFVTSLARAGTTILLEVLARQGEFAAATYRHMPFALAPLMWSELTRGFRKPADAVERAHGDGLTVGFDSPEAFEEMAWLAFWKDQYARDHIRPWPQEAANPAFERFFELYRAKVVATRPGAERYLAKNNASIARLGYLQRICPDATLLIPVRDPMAHVRSLMRQHARFGRLHAQEPFGRRYMEGIGHFEFGQALRPILFDGAPPAGDEAAHPDFWLRYWADVHEGVLATAGAGAVFLDHDALSADPRRHLPVLARALGLQDRAALAATAPRFRAPRPAAPPEDADRALLARVREVHAALIARCLIRAPAPVVPLRRPRARAEA